ncbi:MAG: hypothetical protein LBC40_06100 [Dysgonamonadaceae bacterium]|jgi:hypothetical protein|nr:hypothetical protein [Dysgonamonadaceae bacterium]
MLHFFNPGHETAVLNASPHYMPPAKQLKMMQDLSCLPAWYASEHDFVWTDKKLPAAVNEQNIGQYQSQLLHEKVSLWGISPSAIRFFEQISQKHRLNLQLPVWSDAYGALCSRRTAKNCLQYLIARTPEIDPDIVPQHLTDIASIERILKQDPGKYLIKSPFSSSGRGLLWLSGDGMDRSSGQILSGMLKRQGSVSLEKALDKKEDFSMQFHSDGKGKIFFEGLSLFYTDAKGNYLGSLIASQKQIERIIANYMDFSLLENIREKLMQYLAGTFSTVYEGHIGTDMMIYRENGAFRFHPCVEINARTTMGFLALQLHKRLPEEDGFRYFRIIFSDTPCAILQKHRQLQAQSGYMSLCPVDESTHYLAFINRRPI